MPPPPLPTQLHLPLERLPAPPPQPEMVSIQPKNVWRTIDQRERTQIRLIWLRVIERVIDERP